MIAVENLGFTYPNGRAALHDVSLEINDGEFVAIMGENGAGKTTLVKHFNGLLKPTNGQVTVDGVDTRKSTVASLSKSVGLVFQNPDHQLFSETVKQEVAFSLKNFQYPEEVIEKRVKAILATLDLTPYIEVSPFLLSGGERKRVALATVLAWNPKHIVLDEPTIGQDYQQKDKLRNFILQLVTQGKTVIVVSHDVEFVAECKPRVVLLSKGKVLADGPAADVLTDQSLVDKASLVRPQMAQLFSSLAEMGMPTNVIDVYTAKKILADRFRKQVKGIESI